MLLKKQKKKTMVDGDSKFWPRQKKKKFFVLTFRYLPTVLSVYYSYTVSSNTSDTQSYYFCDLTHFLILVFDGQKVHGPQSLHCTVTNYTSSHSRLILLWFDKRNIKYST